jgi:hypothetical protein
MSPDDAMDELTIFAIRVVKGEADCRGAILAALQ